MEVGRVVEDLCFTVLRRGTMGGGAGLRGHPQSRKHAAETNPGGQPCNDEREIDASPPG